MKRDIIIGITPSVSDGVIKMRENYANAVLDAGGVPVFLPYTTDTERLIRYSYMLDGLLFSGGVDVDPVRYGEEVRFDSVEINRERDAFELELFDVFYATKKPIMGICRGIQLINVALGGTLNQHIEGHRQSESRAVFERTARLTPGSRLQEICGGAENVMTNSFHHQSLKDVPYNVRISALAEDMTVEAIEDTEHLFLVAVQWHPELFYDKDENAARLFHAFVDAAREMAEGKGE